MASATQRKCRALNRHGLPCAAHVVTDAGLCAMHAGLTDPRAAGRKGGLATKRMTRSLRDLIRSEVDPELIVSALKAGLTAPKESDRITAARLVLAEAFAAEEERKLEPEG